MENRFSQLRAPGLIAAFAALMLALCAFACPATAMADATVVAHSGEGDQRVDYTSINDALNAGYNGATIVMDADWTGGEVETIANDKSLVITAGKKITIDMAGHTIKNAGKATTIEVGKGAELMLTSSKKAEFHYKGCNPDDGSARDYTLNAGGLVTNVSEKRGGILVRESGKLTLDGVSVAGCFGYASNDEAFGGVDLENSSTLDMKNGATIEHNLSHKHGGGVNANGANVTINMSNASISDNWADWYGGVSTLVVWTSPSP